MSEGAYRLSAERWAAKCLPAFRRAVAEAIDEGFGDEQIRDDIVDLLNAELVETNKSTPRRFRQARAVEFAAIHKKTAELIVEAVKAERGPR